MRVLWLQMGSGLLESVAPFVVAASVLVMLVILAAIAGFAYKSLQGDGTPFGDEATAGDSERTDEAEATDGVTQGGEDDEWKYY